MKRILFLFVSCAFFACAQEATDKAGEQQAAERRANLRQEILRKNGGFVIAPQKGPQILFRNMQTVVSHDIVTNVVDNIGKVTRLPFKADVVKAPKEMDPLKLTKEALSKEIAGAVLLVDVKGWPALWVAPEASWAIVNVDALRDKADKEQLDRRVQQELWRAACYAMGAGDSKIEKCVMNTVAKPEDLDKLNIVPYPEYLGKMLQHAKSLGVEASRTTTYRKALEEGWAPKPENEFQQAIWDELKK